MIDIGSTVTELPPRSTTSAVRTGEPCLTCLSWRFRRAESVRKSPTTYEADGPAVRRFPQHPRTPQKFNSHSSRVGSVQRILSVVPASVFFHSAGAFQAGTTDRMLFDTGRFGRYSEPLRWLPCRAPG